MLNTNLFHQTSSAFGNMKNKSSVFFSSANVAACYSRDILDIYYVQQSHSFPL